MLLVGGTIGLGFMKFYLILNDSYGYFVAEKLNISPIYFNFSIGASNQLFPIAAKRWRRKGITW